MSWSKGYLSAASIGSTVRHARPLTVFVVTERMERERKRESGSKGAIVAAGIVCSVVGAAVGALLSYMWNKNDVQQNCYSRYVPVIQVVVLVFHAL
jgi:uncharacterized membrane protein